MIDLDPKKLRAADTWYWAHANKIMLGGQEFRTRDHEYEIGPLQCDHPNQCAKKGAQMGFTEIGVLKTLHGHVYHRYPQGSLYLFPTWNDVTDFSKARFNPLIYENPCISRHVRKMGGIKSTEAATIKRIGKSVLYLRSARETTKIEGVKGTSSALKTVPVDRLNFDERDEMSDNMVDLAMHRLDHSDIKEVFKLSTPSIPDFGIDQDYQNSDQRVWMIKCESCGHETCLELEFPDCLKEALDGKVIRSCRNCGKEIYSRHGKWVALYPDVKDSVGWWISQLNSRYVDPKDILKDFRNPPNGNIAEVYNSMLGMAYIAAENRLTRQNVYNCCGPDAMEQASSRPRAMGVDLGGKVLHVVIGYPIPETEGYRITYVGRVGSFNDVHDLAKKHNVLSAVIDAEPETRKARDFQAQEPYRVYLCDYQERLKVGKQVDEQKGIVTVRRTEICDTTHDIVINHKLEIPRRCAEVEEYALEMSNIAKVLIEDKDVPGSRVYRYRKLGADHYRHTTNYFHLACQDSILTSRLKRFTRGIRGNKNKDRERAQSYDPLGRRKAA